MAALSIAGVPARESVFEHDGLHVRFLEVDRLDDLVDRDALLREAAVPEPPYWAHLWIGARGLARELAGRRDLDGKTVLDLGCGIGLPGLVAAARGARVLFADHAPEALAFVEASLALSGLEGETRRTDFTTDDLGRRFDEILAAEVVYDPAAYGPLATFLDRHLAPDGTIRVTDAFRSDARTFFDRLAGLGFTGERRAVHEWEDGRPQGVVLWAFRR